MRLRVLLLAVGCLLSAAAAGWADLGANIPWPNDSIGLHDIQFFGEEGWVLGRLAGSSRLFHTTDGGATFEMKPLPYEPTSMHWLDRQECYIGDHNGFVLRTTNAGDSWTLVGTATRAIYDITFPPTGDTGFAVGFNGLGDRVTASGVIRTPTGINSHLNCASFPRRPSLGWACNAAVIAHFVGDSWCLDQSYPYGCYNAVFFVNESLGWCVGDRTLKTTDGMEWEGQPVDTALFSVQFLDTLRGWAAGALGCVLSTTDGGATWRHEPTSSMTDRLLMKVFAVDTGTVYVVGNLRTLLKYTSGGGVEEAMNDKRGTMNVGPTVVRGVLFLPRSASPRSSTSWLLDISGRKVLELRTGPNDVSYLAPGVYFVHSAGDSRHSALSRVALVR